MIVSANTKGIAERIQRGDYEIDEHKVADAILNRPALAHVLTGSVLEPGQVDRQAIPSELRSGPRSHLA